MAHSSERLLALLLPLALLAACGGARAQTVERAFEAPERAAPLVQPRAPQTQVLYLSALRELPPSGWASWDAIAHALRSFEPDVVLVELPHGTSLRGADPGAAPFAQAPEVLEVVAPYARQHGVDVVGVSARSEEAARDERAYWDDEPHGPPNRHFVIARARARAGSLRASQEGPPDWMYDPAWVHARGAEARWLSYFAEDHMGEGGVLTVHTRHLGLIEDALADWRGQRVAIVFAAESRWIVEPALRMRAEVDLVPPRYHLP